MKSPRLPLVSIISINWNKIDDTRDMLTSLTKITYPNYEIIVVDNNSTKCNPRQLKEEFPEIRLVINRENLGFAGGNNSGLTYSKGKYILLLNNDTEVDPGFLEPMVELMEMNSMVKITSPKIYFFDEPGKLQYAGTTPINTITTRGKKIGYGCIDNGQFDQLRETSHANGACMLISRELIYQIGFLNPEYFLYYEENDFCMRTKRFGYKIYFVPGSKIYHKISSSVGKSSPIKTYYLNRNRLLFIRRNINGIKMPVAIVYYLLLAFPKTLFINLIKSRYDHVKALFDALIWNVKDAKILSFKTLRSA